MKGFILWNNRIIEWGDEYSNIYGENLGRK